MFVAVWTSMLCCNCSVGCLIWVSRSGTRHVDFSWRLRYRQECFFCITQAFGYLLFLLVIAYVRCIYNSGYHLCSLRPVLKLHSCLLIIIDLLLLSSCFSVCIFIDYVCILILFNHISTTIMTIIITSRTTSSIYSAWLQPHLQINVFYSVLSRRNICSTQSQ